MLFNYRINRFIPGGTVRLAPQQPHKVGKKGVGQRSSTAEVSYVCSQGLHQKCNKKNCLCNCYYCKLKPRATIVKA